MDIETSSFAELESRINGAGLYKKRYGSYAVYAGLVLAGLAVSLYLVTVTDNVWLQVANALFFAFMSVQAGMLGHDFSHQQVFRSSGINRFFAVVCWSVIGGIGEEWWFRKHNAHHKHVNHVDLDPDLEIPFLFGEEQQSSKPAWIKKYLLPYQHVLFFFILPLVYPNFIFRSLLIAFQNISLKVLVEIFLVIGHFVLLFGFVMYHLPWFVGVIFFSVAFLAAGLYMSLVFAPNHKGMDIKSAHEETVWTDQITLTRNLYPSFWQFHFFGGLNYQIEHHLFPSMARYNYPRAHKIIKAFCVEHNISYYETSWWQSQKEIYLALKKMAQHYVD